MYELLRLEAQLRYSRAVAKNAVAVNAVIFRSEPTLVRPASMISSCKA